MEGLEDHLKPPPAFQFYPVDFIEGTADMTDSEVGLYMRLLCAQWTRGSLSGSDSDLLKFSHGNPKAASDLVQVRKKFSVKKFGKLQNKRLEEVRKKARDFKLACSRGGKKGGGNPEFIEGKPNPYYGKKDKGGDKGGLSTEDKGGDKGPINSLSLSSSLTLSEKEDDKVLKRARDGNGKGDPLTDAQRGIATWFEGMLQGRWKNDAGKWVNRIRENEEIAQSVAAEVHNAFVEGRIKTTTAQYAEQMWKEFTGR